MSNQCFWFFFKIRNEIKLMIYFEVLVTVLKYLK